ncbi:astacin-like metalloendopeptidase isoform X1 [Hemiscyllium ocellatum]|uniref:astacin-like metalloendopeptidase isoform X1 n=1 Tax=Hemiscyllium ocellatum TaxID=170820 RepID=UPI0029672813|nr:astacin-like metalloendopeptidase isoform X1 [Hemiscyllium ocellatum]
MYFPFGLTLTCLLNVLWSNAAMEQHLLTSTFQDAFGATVDHSDVISLIMEINKDLINTSASENIIGGDYREHPGSSCFSGHDSCLWPSSNMNIYVPYIFRSNYNKAQRAVITASMAEFETLTCIKFKYRTREMTYLEFIDGIGCWSYVGPGKQRAQEISLQKPHCVQVGIIQHQLMHALGFYHENCRTDRDDYVELKMENIKKEAENNFKKQKSNNLVTAYDYVSVMHYGRYVFSKSLDLPTIVPKPDPNVEIGQYMSFSELDVLKINKLYQCQVCGNLLTKSDGIFTSPNYPNMYPSFTNCKWIIRAPLEYKIIVEFDFFYIQPFIGCYRDHLKIHDGSNIRSPILKGPACGKLAPAVISSQNKLLITFFSGGQKHSRGFSAKYQFVKCGEMLTASPTRIIGRVEYKGSMKPHEVSNCFWLIQAHRGHKVVLEITTYNFQQSIKCIDAYLEIHDVSVAPPIKRGIFCGQRPIPVIEGIALLIEFSHPGSKTQPGLRIDYKCVASPIERKGEGSIQRSQCSVCMLVLCTLLISSWTM